MSQEYVPKQIQHAIQSPRAHSGPPEPRSKGDGRTREASPKDEYGTREIAHRARGHLDPPASCFKQTPPGPPETRTYAPPGPHVRPCVRVGRSCGSALYSSWPPRRGATGHSRDTRGGRVDRRRTTLGSAPLDMNTLPPHALFTAARPSPCAQCSSRDSSSGALARRTRAGSYLSADTNPRLGAHTHSPRDSDSPGPARPGLAPSPSKRRAPPR